MTKQTDHSFDKTAVYESEIKPLLEKVKETCKQHGIPMIAAIVYRCEENEDEIDSYFASGACAAASGWMPDEMLMCASILGGTAKMLPLPPAVFKGHAATGKHGKN